jgi:hypothetical protein
MPDRPRTAYVCEADVVLPEDVDPSVIGAAVTTALCGAPTHEGRTCRWPHNNDYERHGRTVRFRTLFVADPEDEPEVRRRIATALESDDEEFTVRDVHARPVAASERELATRLDRTPRPS